MVQEWTMGEQLKPEQGQRTPEDILGMEKLAIFNSAYFGVLKKWHDAQAKAHGDKRYTPEDFELAYMTAEEAPRKLKGVVGEKVLEEARTELSKIRPDMVISVYEIYSVMSKPVAENSIEGQHVLEENTNKLLELLDTQEKISQLAIKSKLAEGKQVNDPEQEKKALQILISELKDRGFFGSPGESKEVSEEKLAIIALAYDLFAELSKDTQWGIQLMVIKNPQHSPQQEAS